MTSSVKEDIRFIIFIPVARKVVFAVSFAYSFPNLLFFVPVFFRVFRTGSSNLCHSLSVCCLLFIFFSYFYVLSLPSFYSFIYSIQCYLAPSFCIVLFCVLISRAFSILLSSSSCSNFFFFYLFSTSLCFVHVT